MGHMDWIRGLFGVLLLAITLGFGVLISTTPASAQQVVVQGANVDPASLKPYFSGTDPASIERGVEDLKATGIYSNVSAQLENGKIVVTLSTGAQIINRVAFEGNSKIETKQLEVEVQSKPHTAYDEATAEADVGRIKDAYKKYGHNEAKVTKRLVQLPNGRVDLVFTIDEGGKTGIRQIKFVGNHAVSDYRLSGLMQTSTMNFLSWIKSTDVYDPDRLASDEEAIRRYYMKNGYADFRITNTDVVYQADPPGYVITITMDEGPQYHVSSVSVVSNIPKVDGPALLRFVQMRPGDVYDAGAVDKSVDAISRDVARQGYAFSEARPHGERDTANNTIALSFSVDNGPKVYIERIDIVGNTRTRDYVIRREFDIGEGDPYNHALIEQAERRLNSLGYFKKVHISNRPGSAPDRVIVIVEVEDQPTGSISLSGGYSTTQGFLAELAYTETNFLGRGQYVRLSVSDGQYSQGWKASFTEPYFLGQRLAAGFDVYHQVNDLNPYALYQNWTTGATLRLGVPITDDLTLQPNYSLYQTKISIPDTFSQPYDDCVGPQPDLVSGRNLHSGHSQPIHQLFEQRRGAGGDQAGGRARRHCHFARRILRFSSIILTIARTRRRATTPTTSRKSPGSAGNPSSCGKRSMRGGTTRSPRISSAWFTCRAVRSIPTAGASRSSSITSCKVPRWCAASLHPGLARATSPTRMISRLPPSAARPIMGRRRRWTFRSSVFRKKSG